MDILVEGYLKAVFHPETIDTIHHAFDLFEKFDLQDYESDFVNLLMAADDQLPQATQDHFITFVHQKIDLILHAHLLNLSEFTPLHQKVAVLDGLYAVQHLNDYSNIITILEGEFSHEEKLAEVLAQVCDITAMAFLSVLDGFDQTTIDTLKNFVYGKLGNEGHLVSTYTERQLKIVELMKEFKKFRQGKNCLGLMLLDSNVLIGQPLDSYVPYINDYLTSQDYDELIVNIFSLILLTDEGLNNPLLVFRKHSGTLLSDLQSITKVDTGITHLQLAFDKWKNDQEVTGATQ